MSLLTHSLATASPGARTEKLPESESIWSLVCVCVVCVCVCARVFCVHVFCVCVCVHICVCVCVCVVCVTCNTISMTSPFSPTRRKLYSTLSTLSLMQPKPSTSPSAGRRLSCCTSTLHVKRTVLMSTLMAPTGMQWNTLPTWVASFPMMRKSARILTTAHPKPAVPLEDCQREYGRVICSTSL